VVAILKLNSSNQPTSGNVASVRDVSGMVGDVGAAVEIVSPAYCAQWLFPLPVSVAAVLDSVAGQRQEMSVNVDSVIFKSGMVETVEVAVEIVSSRSNVLPLPL